MTLATWSSLLVQLRDLMCVDSGGGDKLMEAEYLGQDQPMWVYLKHRSSNFAIL